MPPELHESFQSSWDQCDKSLFALTFVPWDTIDVVHKVIYSFEEVKEMLGV